MQALINFGSEVIMMIPTFVAKLGFVIRKTDVGAQKIDGSSLVTYEMVLAGFSVQNKLEKVWFFKETFLLADTSIKMVLEMPFLTFSDVNLQFREKELE